MAVLAYTPLEGDIFPYKSICIAVHFHQLDGLFTAYSKMAAMQVLSLGKFVRGLRVGELVVGLRPPEATPRRLARLLETHIFHVFHVMMYNGLVA